MKYITKLGGRVPMTQPTSRGWVFGWVPDCAMTDMAVMSSFLHTYFSRIGMPSTFKCYVPGRTGSDSMEQKTPNSRNLSWVIATYMGKVQR